MIDPSIIESLGVSAILAVLCITLISKFVQTDKKVVAMHRRMDNLKDQITKAMEETKDSTGAPVRPCTVFGMREYICRSITNLQVQGLKSVGPAPSNGR